MPLRYAYQLNGSPSGRCAQGGVSERGRYSSAKLVDKSPKVEKLANYGFGNEGVYEGGVFDDGEEVRLLDEVSENELKAFAFGCIESLAGLGGSGEVHAGEVLDVVVREKLGCFLDLLRLRGEVEVEAEAHSIWSEMHLASVKSSVLHASEYGDEMGDLSNQVMNCVTGGMMNEVRKYYLQKRIDCFLESVPEYVVGVGIELGLPESVMRDMGVLLRGRMSEIAV